MSDTSDLCLDRRNDIEPVLAPVWKNLIFMKDGRSVLGYHSFPSEAKAKAGAKRGETALQRLVEINPNQRVVTRIGGRTLYFCREYSHCIQVPCRA